MLLLGLLLALGLLVLLGLLLGLLILLLLSTWLLVEADGCSAESDEGLLERARTSDWPCHNQEPAGQHASRYGSGCCQRRITRRLEHLQHSLMLQPSPGWRAPGPPTAETSTLPSCAAMLRGGFETG